MQTLLKLQLQAICGGLETVLLDKSLPHSGYIQIEEIKQEIESALDMLQLGEDTGIPDCTLSNTMVATLDVNGILELTFRGNHIYRDKIGRDPKPSIISEALDMAALHCNNSDIKFLHVKVDRKFLALSTINLTNLLERMTAFSASTDTIAILPPELLIQMKMPEK